MVEEIKGGDFVEKLLLRDTKDNSLSELPVEGVFIFIGLEPNTGFLKGTIDLDNKGYIITDQRMRTSM